MRAKYEKRLAELNIQLKEAEKVRNLIIKDIKSYEYKISMTYEVASKDFNKLIKAHFENTDIDIMLFLKNIFNIEVKIEDYTYRKINNFIVKTIKDSSSKKIVMDFFKAYSSNIEHVANADKVNTQLRGIFTDKKNINSIKKAIKGDIRNKILKGDSNLWGENKVYSFNIVSFMKYIYDIKIDKKTEIEMSILVEDIIQGWYGITYIIDERIYRRLRKNAKDRKNEKSYYINLFNMFLNGCSYADITNEFGISKQRAESIVYDNFYQIFNFEHNKDKILNRYKELLEM